MANKNHSDYSNTLNKNKYEIFIENYFERQKYEFSKIPEFIKCKKPDYFVKIFNEVLLCEIKGLTRNAVDNEITEYLGTYDKTNHKSKVIYPTTIATIRNKIDESNSQFKSFESLTMPSILILINDRNSDNIDIQSMETALFGDDLLLIDKKTQKEVDMIKRNGALSPCKNEYVSSVGYCNLEANLIKEIKLFKNQYSKNHINKDLTKI